MDGTGGARALKSVRPRHAALAWLLVLGLPAAAEPVRVWLDWPAARPSARKPVRVCATAAADGAAPCASSVTTTRDECVLELGAGTWTLSAQAEGFWSAPADLMVAAAPSGTRLSLWPLATLAGEVTLASGGTPPPDVEVRFTSAAGADQRRPPVSGTTRCALAGARWRCALPAGVLDLELRFGGLVPHYAPDVVLIAGQETHLGTLRPSRAASLAGWIVLPAHALPDRLCRAALRDDAAPQAPTAAPIDARGFFQVVGPAPGERSLAIDCPPFAQTTRNVTIDADAETRLPRPLVPLDVVVVPPLDPHGRPWKLDVFRFKERTELAVLEPASAQGRWFRHRVAPGPHEVDVASGAGTYWLHQVIEAREGSGAVTLQVPMRRIAGTLRAGREPLRAELTFADDAALLAGRVPVERQPRIAVQTGDDGGFEAWLPASAEADAGGWTIEAHSRDPPVNQTLESVSPELRADGVAWFELVLRPPSVRGRVLSAEERPAPHVQVRAESFDSRWDFDETATDENGAFQFVGLAPGRYRVSAEGTCEPQDAEVALGSAPELLFVSRAPRAFRGQVMGGGRPVAAAWVHVWRFPGVQQANYLTGADGRFEVQVPGDAAELGLTVRASGYAFKMTRVPQDGRELQVDLDASGGDLVLDIPEPAPDEAGTGVVLVHNQSLEALEILKAWAHDNEGLDDGRRLVMPRVEPGDYSLCRVPPRESASLWNGSVSPAFCSRTERLASGATTVLSLPKASLAVP